MVRDTITKSSLPNFEAENVRQYRKDAAPVPRRLCAVSRASLTLFLATIAVNVTRLNYRSLSSV